ncbi:gamma-glutamylcyclotransferase [Paraclostridium bifermentans]|uniref:Gamma-glutamylcyclotransferase n=1 Tax=Paraclostridium bifermentans TaxID=1490 RepID=A0ABY8R958_PARBF|nr:gamma-glutamylcyclotransferase [Paraclostridium bifermentans]
MNGHLYHLDNKGYPAVVKGSKKILGELMELNDFELTLKELDAMENYELDGLNNEYNRREVDVTLLDGSIEKAYFYEYNKDAQINKGDVLIFIECGDWKEYMSNK